MRISDFLKSVSGRIITIHERSSEYVYWKRAVVAILIGGILAAGVLYGLYQLRGWEVPVAVLVVIGIIALFYRRNRFFHHHQSVYRRGYFLRPSGFDELETGTPES